METYPEGEIRARIARQGKITFAEFMEVALYHAEGGYYTGGASADTRRDYYTSPAAHPAFGALIAIQLWRMWEVLGCPSPFYVIEMGAGGGMLARDVVGYIPALPGRFGEALRYVALDRSSIRAKLDGVPATIQRVITSGMPVDGIVGCLISNELVDSFPVHRFQIQGGALKEAYVTLDQDRFVEFLDEPSTPLVAQRFESCGFSPAEGYRGEVNLQIGPWMKGVAEALDRGFVLTVDYGYEVSELYSPERAHGTLQTYYRHTDTASPFERIGMQDITAHVDFSSLVSTGQAAGLIPVGLCTQAQFLYGLGLDRWMRRLRTEGLMQRERDANTMAMRELVRAEGLGGFNVLVQEKGTGVTELSQLGVSRAPSGESSVLTDELPVPLLRPDHVPLLEGRYPHTGWQWEGMWPQGDEHP